MTLSQLLSSGADEAIALAGVESSGRPTLSYASLRAQLAAVARLLRSRGIEASDRVAIVSPNGPSAATSLLGVASAAVACPLNPAYTEDEFDFYLRDLGAKALLADPAAGGKAEAVAARLGIPVIPFSSAEDATASAGTLQLPEVRGDTALGAMPTDDAPALLLHTSGTTARPKIVVLSQRNLCASARNIAQTLALSGKDRGLNVMPLFHIHGIVASLLAPLSAEGCVLATPGFNAFQFFKWLSEGRATWYSAVPTMHRAILDRSERNREVATSVGLRFVRSSSASLPPSVMTELEALFGAPVIEAYGMTEAAHQMTSNPLPPKSRKPGSVGIPVGLEVRIAEGSGEIQIKGENVTAGYDQNPKANADGFVDGWFRTGDQGTLDAEGYLTITGRIKEQINRGGEKISPREIDEILLTHPAVSQAVAFAIPHEKLGEEVGAAIVLRDGMALTERELRDFAAAKLAPFKVPRRVVFLSEIPKGATGKVQRVGLAAKLGIVS